MRVASPYRIPGERLDGGERLAPRVVAPPALDSEADVESIACEYDAPDERFVPIPPREIYIALAVGGGVTMAVTALILWATWWSPS